MAGRPREFDRDVALVKARDAFWSRGYAGTSMADLADALGLASARIYAAFGSKEDLFRECVEHYDRTEGGFADAALAEPRVLRAIDRLLRDAVALYTAESRPGGCMIVGAAANGACENDGVIAWLSELRRARRASIVRRFERAIAEGELPPRADAAALGELYATILHGLSVQARDRSTRDELIEAVDLSLGVLRAQVVDRP